MKHIITFLNVLLFAPLTVAAAAAATSAPQWQEVELTFTATGHTALRRLGVSVAAICAVADLDAKAAMLPCLVEPLLP